jgi:LuxR family maltose regulon positive regulatory protein
MPRRGVSTDRRSASGPCGEGLTGRCFRVILVPGERASRSASGRPQAQSPVRRTGRADRLSPRKVRGMSQGSHRAALLTTKLFIPPPRPNLVSRPRLVERLEEGLCLDHRLTLVSATAGFGKTTLLSEWLHHLDRPAAWLSLDDEDNDPVRFLTYLVATLQKVDLNIGQALQGQPGSSPGSEVQSVLASLINDLATTDTALVLVLDDLHTIQNEAIHDALNALVEHQPPALHLVLASRVDPPLPLARLRARGQMTEIRDQDLRFTVQEATQFLNQGMGLGLSEPAISTLEERTEGWIAGLQMAALALRGASTANRQRGEEVANFIETFRGTHRYILDYLVEEVLSQQPLAVQEFLVQTSILERMTGPLCDAVRLGAPAAHGEAAGLAVLAQLEQANLFLMPLDTERRWYRTHHLFADLLRSTLRQTRSPDEIRMLHRRASQWHQDHGLLEEAVRHAIAAQDFERAATIIEANIATVMSRSEPPVLLHWIEKLPQDLLRSRPWIEIYRAWTMSLSGESDQAERLLQEVEARVEPDTPQAPELLGSIGAIRTFLANLRGDGDRVIELAHAAEALLPDEHLNARAMIAYALADTYFARDEMEGAKRATREMMRVGEKAGRLLMTVPALCDLASIKQVEGQLHQAYELLSRARQGMLEREGLNSRVRCPYEIGLASLLYEWNQLDAAYEHVMAGIDYGQRFNVFSHLVSGSLTLMRVFQARGQVQDARDALRRAEQTVARHRVRLAAAIDLKTARVRHYLALGDLETAVKLAEDCRGPSELERLAWARLHLAQGRPDEALHLLERQKTAADAGGRTGRLIEILGLTAVTLETVGHYDTALQTLAEALRLASPEGHVRTFLDLGEPIGELLRKAVAHGLAPDYAASLLATHETDQGPSPSLETLADPLTERELEVLRLLSAGLSNKEIANTLIIAPSTVKQHLKNLYSKLDVHSRTQAVARGQELRLL